MWGRGEREGGKGGVVRRRERKRGMGKKGGLWERRKVGKVNAKGERKVKIKKYVDQVEVKKEMKE